MVEAYLAIVFIGLLLIGMVMLLEMIWIVLLEDGDE